MNKRQSEQGRSVASSTGIWIFIKIIGALGLLPAYIMLVFVSLYYTIFIRFYFKYLKSYRTKLNLKTNIFHIYRHNYSLGANLIDRFAHLSMKKSPFKFTCIGENHLFEALDKKKGLVLISSHIGNQEIGGDVLFDHLPTRVNFVQLDNEKESIKKVTRKITEKRDINIIPTHIGGIEMMVQIKNAINNNEIVCFLGDRVVGDEDYQDVSFLGHSTKFPVGPFKVAAITGAPVVSTITVKTGLKNYSQRVNNLISFENVTSANRETEIKKAIEQYKSKLEEIVTDHPYQWFNFYDYWDEFN
jgi:predicted LPLAT superfamily acyltransferase